jgi:hypothetical protein
VHFDTALNLAWLLLGIGALASTLRATMRRSAYNRSSAWLHVVGVALIVAALFPYISATDDLVRSENLSTREKQDHSSPGKKTPNDNLIRLYETLDSPLACPTCILTLTFFSIWLIFLPKSERDHQVAPACAGRSPPLSLSF